ncbi:phage/plasmid primase, P4 family [Streptomyces sp. NPDC127051]|uniref:phage/plasmid primase, P4 family n=1 Tax=Streptomyces sp. NPDC127051 TaxID=3347119 RepID=UPI0036656058
MHDEEERPAFRPEFEGLIGSTFGNEPNDKANGKRMSDLYGKVFRYVEEQASWYVWSGKHWRRSKGVEIRAAAHDMSSYMEEIEIFCYEPEDAPPFPNDWNVISSGGTPYKALLGKNGALNKAPVDVMSWASVSAARAEFIGERLSSEQGKGLYQDSLDWIEQSKGSGRIDAAIKEARVRAEFKAKTSDFDTVRTTFVVQNGQFNTKTRRFTPVHRAEDLNTRVCEVVYDPNAHAPLWNAYMEKNQPNRKTRRYIQKLMGYSLSGDSNQKLIAFLFSQVGDTGKSLFLAVMDALFGTGYAVNLATDTLSPRKSGAGGRDPDRHAIRGKRLITASELEAGAAMDESFVKAYTGGDVQSTRSNFETENTRWQPEGLMVVASNHLMKVTFEDSAIWGRIRIIPWKVSFPPGHPDRDEELAQKIINSELSGVLNWVLEGLRLYREEGLVSPTEVALAMDEYRKESDSVEKFLNESFAEGSIEALDFGYCRPTDLYKMARKWGQDCGIAIPTNIRDFNKRLQAMKFRYAPLPASHPHKKREGVGNSRKIQGIHIPDAAKIRFKLSD